MELIISITALVVALVALYRSRVPKVPPCQHKWETTRENPIFRHGKHTGSCLQQTCIRCGTLQFHNPSVYD